MLVLLSWLKEYIDLPYTPKEIGALLTRLGIEVDHIKPYPAFQGVIVATITKVSKHPEADNLSIVEVNDGTKIVKLISSASNCREGMRVAFAQLGAKLPTATGAYIDITPQTIRGIPSNGMLCSGKELGILDDDSGLLELPNEYKEGTNLEKLWEDTCFEVSLTPNLGHLLSVMGIARELSAATKIPLKEKTFIEVAESPSFKVTVEDKEDCPHYSALLISGITVGPSPFWLKKKLESSGIRSINNIVDITNLVAHELGAPLHAFDFEKIGKKELVVRKAHPNEEMLFLDDVVRKFPEESIVIGDGNGKACALAGIMGGMESSVSKETHSCVLEAAFFNPAQIRKARKSIGVVTESSWRFERGCDPKIQEKALSLAYSLIKDFISKDAKIDGFADCIQPLTTRKVQCRQSRTCKVLGYHVSMNEMEDIFSRLGFKVSSDTVNITVEVPSWRHDISEEIDLIEEIFRLAERPEEFTLSPYQGSTIDNHPLFAFERKLRKFSIASGLQEFVTCSLISPRMVEIVKNHPIESASLVKVMNPMSQEQSILRPSMLPGFLDVIKRNFNHRNFSIQGYEIGNVYFKEDKKYEGDAVVAFVLTGDAEPEHFITQKREVDFFDLKGIIENLMRYLFVEKYELEASTYSVFHPKRQAKITSGGLQIGSLGEIHPSVLRNIDIDQRVFFAELNLFDLYSLLKLPEIAKELSLYPSSERDWTVTLDESIRYEDLISAIKEVQSPILESVTLKAIFRHEKLGKDKKNVTLHFVFRDIHQTVSQGAVDAEFQKLTEHTEQQVTKL